MIPLFPAALHWFATEAFATAHQTQRPYKTAYELGGQVTVISQSLFRFHSPYSGANSLVSKNETDWTDTYTLYMGLKPSDQLELYVDPEMARGAGIGNGAGLAAYTNGDVLRIPGGTAGVAPLPQSPYFARYFARWTVALGHGTTDIAAGENQIPGKAPSHRLVVTAGKVSTADIFDTNSYANSTRTQFMNWALINNPAYDYAADTRGYSQGIAAQWICPNWALRAGVFMMPVIANGPSLAQRLSVDHGDQVEVELHPKLFKGKEQSVARLLAYRNVAHMGDYADANGIALGTHSIPEITATRRNGRQKFGLGLNLEQALADDGDTGAFARFGWNDGATESFAYTECESTVSLGIQISGKRWHAPSDRWAIALADDGLSAAHREYLALGGQGFLLGDGRLNYGHERLLETYYTRQFNKYLQASLDFQLVANPGYNKDRGAVPVLSGRLHFEF